MFARPAKRAASRFGGSTGQLAGCVPKEATMLRIRGVARYSGQLERLAVVPGGVAAAMIDLDRVLRRSLVEVVAVEWRGISQFRVVEKLSLDPESRRRRRGLLSKRCDELGLRFELRDHNAEQLVHPTRVTMRVNEPGDHAHTGGVDHSSARCGHVAD